MNDEVNEPDAWTDRVARDVEPPAALRVRVVASLRDEGLLRDPSQRRSAPWWLRVAALLVAFVAGWASALAYQTRAVEVAPSHGRYMFLLYGETTPPGETGARVAEYGAWAQDIRRRGGQVTGERLEDDATPIGSDAPAGPSLGGFFIVDAPSADAARELAAAHPHVRHGGTIVIRPVAGS